MPNTQNRYGTMLSHPTPPKYIATPAMRASTIKPRTTIPIHLKSLRILYSSSCFEYGKHSG